MNLNPFSEELSKARRRASHLESKISHLRTEIKWYESSNREDFLAELFKIDEAIESQRSYFDIIDNELVNLEAQFEIVSSSINSLWNPKNWLNQDQKKSRSQRRDLLKPIEKCKATRLESEEKIQKLHLNKDKKQKEIAKFEQFDFDSCSAKKMNLAREHSEAKRTADKLAKRADAVDKALAPMLAERDRIESKIGALESDLQVVQDLERDLNNADNSYERAMIHQDCQEIYGIGSPQKLAGRKQGEIDRLNRDLEKLLKRARSVASKSAREVSKLIIDGNNLCYSSGRFIGLDALAALTASASSSYKFLLVFDASIRSLLSSGDEDIRRVFGEKVDIHVVSTNGTADETILSLAEDCSTTFVISNDRFVDFPEKSAVREDRVIRHEIVGGQILVPDLGVSQSFQSS